MREKMGTDPRMGRHAVVGAGGAAMQAVASASGVVSEVAMSQ